MPELQDDDIFNDAEAEADRKSIQNLRRGIIGSVVGVALLIGPIVVANTIINDDPEVETNESATPVAALKRGDTSSTTVPTTVAPPPTEPPTTEPPVTEPPVVEAPPATEAPPAPPVIEEAPVEEVAPPESSGGGFGDPYDYATWDALADCESGGNWSINTGNGYYGGLQFSLSSWRGAGGTGYPHEHSREEQIAIGINLYESGGWGHWPSCSRKLGLR